MNKYSMLGIILVAVIVIGGAMVLIPGNGNNQPADNETGTQGYSIKVVGSSTVLPIAQDAASAWTKENPTDQINVSGGGSGAGIQALIDGTTDIANASRPMKESEQETATNAGVDPVKHSIAKGAVCIVVHPNNPIENIKPSIAQDIFSGDISSWSELGWSDGGNIQVYDRESGSGTRETFVSEVMGTKKVTSGASTNGSNGAMRSAVSQNTHAIGYVGLGYVNDEIKALEYDEVMPSKDTVASGQYPITRTLFMYTDGPATGLENEFISYAKNAENIIGNNGFIPL